MPTVANQDTRETRFASRSVQSFNHDGMELARRRTHRRSLPVGKLLLFVLFVFVFKISLVLHMGAAAYGAKMQALSDGTGIEKVAATAMQLDPVSKTVIDQLRHFLR